MTHHVTAPMTPEERAEKLMNTRLVSARLIADTIRAAVAEEREACAKLMENQLGVPLCAQLIRARGKGG